ncbi:transcription factor WhiB [Streptomyces sp. STR69]|uniref:transcription factor WhiB n=1 Tax=Streptomyces sp. STR69 TaxID=1796942 RepID=UPI0021C5E592|nr:transcription factor WhiB [Streptomyces sp. STR69]
MSGWLGGVQVRRTDWGQTPIADFLCTACGTHKRVAGRDKVRDFMKANPIGDHKPNCQPTEAT